MQYQLSLLPSTEKNYVLFISYLSTWKKVYLNVYFYSLLLKKYKLLTPQAILITCSL